MSWERRGKQRYYYRAYRIAGRTLKEYVGTGAVGEVAARIDAAAGVQRAAARAARQYALDDADDDERALAPLDALVDWVVFIVMTLEGFTMSKNNWRKRRAHAAAVATAPPTDPPPASAPGSALIERARAGDATAAHEVRAAVDRRGPAESFGGDVAAVAVHHLLTKMVGTDECARTAIWSKMGAIRAELVGPDPTIFVQLVADRVVSTWLHLHRLEGEYAGVDESDTKQLTGQQLALSAAQRRYFATINELVRMRDRELRALVAAGRA